MTEVSDTKVQGLKSWKQMTWKQMAHEFFFPPQGSAWGLFPNLWIPKKLENVMDNYMGALKRKLSAKPSLEAAIKITFIAASIVAIVLASRYDRQKAVDKNNSHQGKKAIPALVRPLSTDVRISSLPAAIEPNRKNAVHARSQVTSLSSEKSWKDMAMFKQESQRTATSYLVNNKNLSNGHIRLPSKILKA